MNLDDTIVAIAPPPGRGGIGVVRLAGPEAKSIAKPMLRLSHDLEPGRATVCDLVEPEGEITLGVSRTGVSAPHDLPHDPRGRIDEVVVTYFAKPHSYTTDDIVEIAA